MAISNEEAAKNYIKSCREGIKIIDKADNTRNRVTIVKYMQAVVDDLVIDKKIKESDTMYKTLTSLVEDNSNLTKLDVKNKSMNQVIEIESNYTSFENIVNIYKYK